MRRSLSVAGAVLILIVLVVAVYAEEPQLLGLSSKKPGASGSSATVSVTAGVSASSGPTGSQDWTTFHGDNSRTGVAQTANFTSVSGAWNSTALDGAVYAEPLVFDGDVFVATENNSVYSLDAQTGSVAWRTNLGPPVDASSLSCGDISPSGITGTPVIDPSTGTIYVATFSGLHHFLWALSTSTGAELWHESAQPPGFIDNVQQERSALTLANGMVYIPYGGLDGDCGQYHGWVVGLPANGTDSMVFYETPTMREGGIWATSGMAVGQNGDIYVTIGNGASQTTFDHGNTLEELSPALKEVGYFAPTNWLELNGGDTDLGSAGPSFVGPDTIFQIGKQGVGYLINASDPGGIGGQEFNATVCAGSFGGNAFASPYVFVPCENGLVALKIANGGFTGAWHSPGDIDAGPPVVTGGVVWTIALASAMLLGFSVSSGQQEYSFHVPGVEHFTGPSAGEGKLFVAAGDVVMAFSLG